MGSGGNRERGVGQVLYISPVALHLWEAIES